MPNVDVVLGTVLMVTGMTLIIAAVFRTLGHSWNLGAYEFALPVAGICLALLGVWLIV